MLPLVACAPLQPPEAMQLVALVELQESVVDAPVVTGLGLTVSVAVGVTLTVALAALLLWPALLLHTSEYVELLVKGPTDWLPELASAPDQLPEPTQDAAFVELQVRVACPPFATTVGDAVSVAVGIGVGVGVGADAELEEPEWQPASNRHAAMSRYPVFWSIRGLQPSRAETGAYPRLVRHGLAVGIDYGLRRRVAGVWD